MEHENKQMGMSDYKEKLLDVRWQKRRLEILEKDHWSCRACATKSGSFHVHHLWYDGSDPWDYPDEALVTLCSSCHKKAPGIDWKRAFLDLNLCEAELLELATMLHWVKNRSSEYTKPIQEKHKCRFFNLLLFIDLFEDGDDENAFLDTGFHKLIKERYTNG